ncbi:MAG TPA: PLP-dependent aspartate aminotransferase family protein [Gemmatimonadaceae bacterium]|nr:PLP-dependent aspartate aminotransferase family protein [Gemmatimonadaceae bacterium]
MSSTRRTRTHSLPTLAVHAGEPAHDADAPVVTPLQQSVSFVHEVGSSDGARSPGYGNAPNAEVVQKKLAALERAEAAVVLSSGMGATACALMALLRPGDHLLASRDLYGSTRRLVTEEFTALGIDVTLVDPFEARGWRKRMRKETRAVFLESPLNPTCRVIDLRPLSYLTHESGLALVVDSTHASPINFRPLEHGADVVIHATTKFLNGHHDVMGGVVLGTASYVEEVRQKMIVWGQAPDPFACWLLERGLKTLDVRVRRQNENALKIAQWCDDRREVRAVHYPGLPTHPDHEVAAEQMDGFGGMLGLELSGGARAADRFVRKLRLIRHAPSLGGVDSLVSEPRYTSHTHLSAEERANRGVPDGFLRLSVGIEDAADLIADIEHALP